MPGVFDARRCAETMAWVRSAAERAHRVVTVCTGAFPAAEDGLLDGARATTHWSSAQLLADEYPAIKVDPRHPRAGDGGMTVRRW